MVQIPWSFGKVRGRKVPDPVEMRLGTLSHSWWLSRKTSGSSQCPMILHRMAIMAAQKKRQKLITAALRVKLSTQNKEAEHGACKGIIMNENGTSQEYLGMWINRVGLGTGVNKWLTCRIMWNAPERTKKEIGQFYLTILQRKWHLFRSWSELIKTQRAQISWGLIQCCFYYGTLPEILPLAFHSFSSVYWYSWGG